MWPEMEERSEGMKVLNQKGKLKRGSTQLHVAPGTITPHYHTWITCSCNVTVEFPSRLSLQGCPPARTHGAGAPSFS